MQQVNSLTEKYIPKTTADSFWLEKHIKAISSVAHNLIIGSPGTGKSSTVTAYLKEHNFSYIYINGSDARGVDTVRTTIQEFIEYDPIGGSDNRAVFIDEIDGFTTPAFNALRSVMEHAGKVRFFATANNGKVIPAPIRSRFNVIEIDINNKEFKTNWINRVLSILKDNNVSYDDPKKFVDSVMKVVYPDFRKVCNILNLSIQDNVLDITKAEDIARSGVGYDETKVYNWVLNSDAENIYNTLSNLKSYDNIMQSFASPLIVWIKSQVNSQKWVELSVKLSMLYGKYMMEYNNAPDKLPIVYAYLMNIKGLLNSK